MGFYDISGLFVSFILTYTVICYKLHNPMFIVCMSVYVIPVIFMINSMFSYIIFIENICFDIN